jgi:hypothetical protein
MAPPSPARRGSGSERRFSHKITPTAPAAAFRRLTAVLPDVAKGGVRQSGVIRNWYKGGNDGSRRKDLLEMTETAPSRRRHCRFSRVLYVTA